MLLGVIVQAAANVNNTYWDFVNGVDTPTVSAPLMLRQRFAGAQILTKSPCVLLPHRPLRYAPVSASLLPRFLHMARRPCGCLHCPMPEHAQGVCMRVAST